MATERSGSRAGRPGCAYPPAWTTPCCLTSYGAVRGDFPGWAWLVFGGLGLLLAGRTLWWAVPDRNSDAAVGDRTVVVRYGARRGLLIACLITAVGIVAIGCGIWVRCGPAWAVVAVLAMSYFLLDKLVLARTISDARLPDERRMRRRTLTFVTAADIVLVLAPLLSR